MVPDGVRSGPRPRVGAKPEGLAVRWMRWLITIATTLVGGIAAIFMAMDGSSWVFGGLLTLAVIVAVLIVCGRLPGQTFFKDSSPTRAHDSLQYP